MNKILDFKPKVQILEESCEESSCVSCPGHLEKQHNFVESWQPFKVLLQEVLHVVFAAELPLADVAHVCQWVKSIQIKDKPSFEVVLYNRTSLGHESTMLHVRLS